MSGPTQVTSWTPTAVTALLRDRLDETITTATWIGSGGWSDCFAFEVDGRQLVARVGRFGNDFLLDEYVSRYHAPQLPIPQTTLVGSIRDEFFAVSEFVPGRPLEQISPWNTMVPSVVDLLEALRTTAVHQLAGWGRWTPATGGQFDSWRDFLLAIDQDPPGSRFYGWKAQLATAPPAQAAFARGYELLQSTIVGQVPRSLVHNDLFNRNVHVTDHEITGVFDWGNSLLGDHLYDLGLLCFWEPWLPHAQAQPVFRALRSLWSRHDGILANFDARLMSCMLHTGLEHIAYHSWRADWPEVDRLVDRVAVVSEIGAAAWHQLGLDAED